ncbi:MAG: hypothetical protein M3Z17_03720 [Gemmatimonadota bacterium]|nr:hypothetical protein [Gemmatimonadota bacterium]
MKDSARRLFDVGVAAALTSAVLAMAGCGRTNKTADVAQDSILVKDANVAEHKVDTAAAASTLVRDRGSAAAIPALTSGAPVKRAPASAATEVSRGTLQPPARVNPTPVLPGRDTGAVTLPPPRIDPMVAPPVQRPPPVTQPVSPSPPAVLQPPATPKKDSLKL